MAISIFGTKANNTDIVVKDTATGDVDLGSGDLTTTGTITAATVVGAGGITQADIWRTTSNITADTGGVSNFERSDNTVTTKVGTGVSFSTPYFSFPETGIYLIQSQVQFAPASDTDNVIWSTVYYNSSTSASNTLAECQGSDGNTSSFSQCILDVTNTTNDKVYFSVASLASGGNITGNTNANNTCVLFLRLGDT
tara:strand:- start:258 stop:845 length:588 start_codon:yes stop_codon:yes gene_type:complete